MTAKQIKRKKKIGKYAIERQIGKGSAANIYLAKQDVLGRKIVVKELLPLHKSNEKIIARFQREAKIVSQFSHDAIVHIYDYWVRGGSYCIAMEYVQGQTLRELLSKIRFVPVHIAAIIIYQICRGLQHAHLRGIIHRDLKPANIIVSNTGQVKILDFGIAHFQCDEDFTSLGAVIGTYHYMSPEQALGKKVAPTSDIFSIGILFYELSTGSKPFLTDEKGEVLDKIVHKRPYSSRKLNPAVSLYLNRIIRKCLRKKPKRRFQDSEGIKVKLEKYLRRYSLDHQMILKHFLENFTPRENIENWPPKFWRRLWYRMCHLRTRTTILLGVGFLVILFVELSLISRDIGLGRQWRFIIETSQAVWNRVFQAEPNAPVELTKIIEESLGAV